MVVRIDDFGMAMLVVRTNYSTNPFGLFFYSKLKYNTF